MSSAGKPVKAEMARICMDAYTRLYTGDQPLPIENAYTEYVRFDTPNLPEWMASLTKSDYNNLRVYFGVYTAEFAKQYPEVESKVGRLTVFLWPYNGDQPAKYTSSAAGRSGEDPDPEPQDGDGFDPFNTGDVFP